MRWENGLYQVFGNHHSLVQIDIQFSPKKEQKGMNERVMWVAVTVGGEGAEGTNRNTGFGTSGDHPRLKS